MCCRRSTRRSCRRWQPSESTDGSAVPHRRDAADDGAARRDARVGPRDGGGRARHDLAGRGLSVVAQARHGGALVDRRVGADGARDVAPDDRLGDHLAVHPSSGAGRDGRARRAGGGRAGPLHPRLRDLEDLPEQRRDADVEDARPDARRGRDRARRPRRRGVRVHGLDVERRTSRRCRTRRTRRAACRRCMSPRPRRRCRRWPARSPTAA